MTERLDRIAAQQERNTSDIGDLISLSRGVIESVATLAEKTDSLIVKIDESNQRFDIQRAEAQADREETRRLWNDAVTQMEADRAAAKAQADADRAETRQNFSAQMEVIQRLLVELVEMNRDNRRLRDRVDNLEQAS